MLTLAKLHSESVAYYESTVDKTSGVDGYYSEDGRQPAKAWMVGESVGAVADVSTALGVESDDVVDGELVRRWFNSAVAPNGSKLGRAPGSRGVPGFDLTFCAPKSASLLWGLTDDESVREAVNRAHAAAVDCGLEYLTTHGGYTRRAAPDDPSTMIIERLRGLSGVRYEHRTSRSGDPHVHSHVLLNNKQLCADGKFRTVDGVSLYHELRAAGMIYQARLRAELSAVLGVEWAETVNGCAEIVGLDDESVLKDFSNRTSEIEAWKQANGVGDDSDRSEGSSRQLARIGQKATRQRKDTTTPVEQLQSEWKASPAGRQAKDMIDALAVADTRRGGRADAWPSVEEVVAEVISQRSTFTRADVVEAAASLLGGRVATDGLVDRVEELVDDVFASGLAWTVTPDRSREHDAGVREGSQRFTAEAVVEEINTGIDLASEAVARRGEADVEITPVPGVLSEAQAVAMRQIVASPWRAGVVVAPAGAGKTTSLKAAREAWHRLGKTVVGLAPTGKAADVMTSEKVADQSSTIARALVGTEKMTSAQVASRMGWDANTVAVVDEAGMVSNSDAVRLLQIASAAGSRVVFVGDPHQYSAVKQRSGLLGTLAREIPDSVELHEVFRQRNETERRMSTWLRDGGDQLVRQAVDWYAEENRLYAGNPTVMLNDAMAGWKADTLAGLDSLLIAGDKDTVDALNRAAQRVLVDFGRIDPTGPACGLNMTNNTQTGFVGDVVITRRNDYSLTTNTGSPVRNGQRWRIEQIGAGEVTLRSCDDDRQGVVVPREYLANHGQLGYATTGHSSQGVTVDSARVVMDVGQADRAAVYVPMTRGRDNNSLYLVERAPGDSETGHGHNPTPVQRRESTQYAADLLAAVCQRDRSDVTPHQVWETAYREWSLERLSSNQDTRPDPFAGTRMAEVMTQRQDKRTQRWMTDDHHVDTTPVVRADQDRPLQMVPGHLLEWLRDNPGQAQSGYQHARDNQEAIYRYNQAVDQWTQLDQRATQTGKDLKACLAQRRGLEQAPKKKGLFGKLFGGNSAEDDQRVALDEQIASLRQMKQDIEAQMRAVAAEHGIKTHVAVTGRDSQSADRRVALWQQLSDPEEVAAETADRQAMQANGEDPETLALRRQWQEMVDAGLWNHPSRPITGFDHALVRDHLMGGQDFSDALSAQFGQPRRQTGQNDQQQWDTNTCDDGMEL